MYWELYLYGVAVAVFIATVKGAIKLRKNELSTNIHKSDYNVVNIVGSAIFAGLLSWYYIVLIVVIEFVRLFFPNTEGFTNE